MGLGARFNAVALALVEALFASTSSSFVFSCVVSRSFDNKTWSIVAVKFCGVHGHPKLFRTYLPAFHGPLSDAGVCLERGKSLTNLAIERTSTSPTAIHDANLR